MTGWMMWGHVVAGLAAWMVSAIIIASEAFVHFRASLAITPSEHALNARLTAIFFFTLSLDLLIVALSIYFWLHMMAVWMAAFTGWLAVLVMMYRVGSRWK